MPHLPTVQYDIGSPVLDARMFCWAPFRQDEAWQDEIVLRDSRFSELIALVRADSGDAERFAMVKRWFVALYAARMPDVVEAVDRFQRMWEPLDRAFLAALAAVLEVEWPTSVSTIHGLVSPSPIAPKWLHWDAFNAPVDDDLDRMRFITAHEVTHLLYFEKVRQIDPTVDPKEFNEPGLPLFVSELLAPILLNDPRIVDVIGPTMRDTYMCARSDVDRVWTAYLAHRETGDPFADFYRWAVDAAGAIPWGTSARVAGEDAT